MAFDSHLPEGIEPGPQTLRSQAEGAGTRGVLPALTVSFIGRELLATRRVEVVLEVPAGDERGVGTTA